MRMPHEKLLSLFLCLFFQGHFIAADVIQIYHIWQAPQVGVQKLACTKVTLCCAAVQPAWHMVDLPSWPDHWCRPRISGEFFVML